MSKKPTILVTTRQCKCCDQTFQPGHPVGEIIMGDAGMTLPWLADAIRNGLVRPSRPPQSGIVEPAATKAAASADKASKSTKGGSAPSGDNGADAEVSVMASAFDDLFAGSARPVLFEQLAREVEYRHQDHNPATIRAIVGPTRDEPGVTMFHEGELERTRFVSVVTDPADPDYGGVERIDREGTFLIDDGGELAEWRVERIDRGQGSVVRVEVKFVSMESRGAMHHGER